MTTVQVSGDTGTIYQTGKGRNSLLLSGVFFIILGIVAITIPMAATLSTAVFIGWLFVAAGLTAMLVAFAFRGSEPFLGKLLISLLTVGAGLFLILSPLAGLNVITVLIVALLVCDGALGLLMAYTMKPLSGWGWLSMFSMITLLAGVFIVVGLPGPSQAVLAMMLGFNFLMSGLASVQLARMFTSTDIA